MKKIAWLTLVIFVLILLGSCIVAGPIVAPPPLKKEVRSLKPGPNYVWISGHWKWTGSKYVWVSGYWSKAPKGKIWVPGHWKKKGRNWVWIPGHWKKK